MQTASGMDLYFEVTITVNSSVVCGKKHKRQDKVSSPYNLYSHEADYRTVSVEVWASPVDTAWAVCPLLHASTAPAACVFFSSVLLLPVFSPSPAGKNEMKSCWQNVVR